MRKMYETDADRVKEHALAYAFAQLGYEFVKLPIRYQLDFIVMRDGVPKAFVEVKHRTCTMNQYPTAMISLGKVMKARQLTQLTDLPSYLLNVYTDCMARFDFAGKFELGKGGRSDRNDWQDQDICAYFPVGDATVLR